MEGGESTDACSASTSTPVQLKNICLHSENKLGRSYVVYSVLRSNSGNILDSTCYFNHACVLLIVYVPFRSFSATIMEVVYGITVAEKGDPYVDIAEKTVASFAEGGLPGTFLVDMFPISA